MVFVNYDFFRSEKNVLKKVGKNFFFSFRKLKSKLTMSLLV